MKLVSVLNPLARACPFLKVKSGRRGEDLNGRMGPAAYGMSFLEVMGVMGTGRMGIVLKSALFALLYPVYWSLMMELFD